LTDQRSQSAQHLNSCAATINDHHRNDETAIPLAAQLTRFCQIAHTRMQPDYEPIQQIIQIADHPPGHPRST
jgi:hypothetical protein